MLIVGVGLLVSNLRNIHEFPDLYPKIGNPDQLPRWSCGIVCEAALGSG